ncbi:MAG: SMC-Scp complex subunit ScpB, partial [Candidatus Hodarchaeota archaeon]
MEQPNPNKPKSLTPTYGKTLIPVRTFIEGALYLSARPLQVSDMARLAGCPEQKVRIIIRELQTEYEERLSAFTIVQLPEDRFVLQLRHEIAPLLENLAPDGLLSEPILRTLGWIAYKQP